MMAPRYFTRDEDAARARLASDIVIVGTLGFADGVLPIDLSDDRAALPEFVEDQVRKVLANLETVLKGHAMTRDNVVSVRVHVVELMRFHERVDTAYAGFFASGRLPTRSFIGIDRLPRGALVSMDFVVSKT